MATRTQDRTRTYEVKAVDPTKTYDEIQENSLKLVRQGQEAVVEGVRAWSEALNSLAPAWQATGWPVRPEEAVDAVFDFAEQTLATQRQVAHQIWGATASVAETASQQAPAAADQVQAAEPAVEKQTAEKQTAEKQTAEKQTAEKQTRDYESMTVEQLQDEAGKAGVEGRSQMNKQELVKALRKHDR